MRFARIFCLACALVGLAARANEDIFSGPQTDGSAIPSGADEGFPSEVVAVAQVRCLSEVAQAIWAQAVGSVPVRFAEGEAQDLRVGPSESGTWNVLGPIAPNTSMTAEVNLVMNGGETAPGMRVYLHSYTRLDVWLAGIPGNQRPIELSGSLAFPRFTVTETNEGWDEWGMPINPRRFLKPAGVQEGDGAERSASLIRVATGGPTQLKYDQLAFRDCVLSALQLQ